MNPSISAKDRNPPGKRFSISRAYDDYAESLKPAEFRTKTAKSGGLKAKLVGLGLFATKGGSEVDTQSSNASTARPARNTHKRVISKPKPQTVDREREFQNRLSAAPPATLRDLRELIRARYKLDNDIWSLRSARLPDRPVVKELMEKSDAIMDEILGMIEIWGANGETFTEEEKKRMHLVRTKLRAPGKRVWASQPPWADY